MLVHTDIITTDLAKFGSSVVVAANSAILDSLNALADKADTCGVSWVMSP